MQKQILAMLMLLYCCNAFSQKNGAVFYTAENGVSMENNIFRFGGDLNKSTQLNGNLKSLRFLNMDSFLVEGKFINFISKSSKITFSSFDSIKLTSRNISLNAFEKVHLNGEVVLGNLKNNDALDSLLTIDGNGQLILVAKQAPLIPGVVYGAGNGLSFNDNIISLGGELNKATNINGSNHSLRFSNIDTFFVGGRHIQFLNSTRKTTISSYDSLNLLSFNSMVLSANHVTVDGNLKLTGYKNSADMDSVLTVDNCGALKLVSQKSLQTIAQNAFINNGNSFGAPAYLGTNDKNFLYFKTNNLARGFIDTSGIFNYNYGVNINNAKLTVSKNIEINGEQQYATTTTEKATYGLNFTAGNEPLARGTLSYNSAMKSMNYTSHEAIRFYSKQSGVPFQNAFADLTINEGILRFGGRNSRNQAVDESAAYHFTDHYTSNGTPKGILFPRVLSTIVRNYQTNPTVGLMFYNTATDNLEVYKKDGWHSFVTIKESATPTTASPTTTESIVNNNSYVQALGDGQKKSFKISHNLNAQFVMVQFIDCGPEANCNLLQILPKGARVELDGKNNALVTFDEAPSFNRYKIMFLRVQ